jgi:hypothetical protein
MAGGPTHVFDYPSGAARFYIMDDFVYSLNGQAAFWISRNYWYPYPPEDTVHNPVPDDAGRFW